MAFPINPSPGDSYTDGYGTVWIYAGAVNGWYRQQVSTPNDTSYTAAISGPAGSNTQVQFNDNGELAGDSGLTYNKTTDALSGGAFIPTGSTIPTNGVYLPSANNVAISTAGTGRLFVDASGRVGINSTPKLSHTNVTSSLNIGSSNLFQRTKDLFISSNFYYNSSDIGKSIASGYAPIYVQDVTNGAHVWYQTNNASAADETVSLSEKMRITAEGKLGLGTSSPSVKLEVSGPTSSNPEIRVVDGTVNTQWYASNGGECIFGTFSNHPIVFRSNGTPRLTISASGSVGVGTTSPGAILETRVNSAGGAPLGALLTNSSVIANTSIGIAFQPNISQGTTRYAIIYGINESGGSGNATGLAFHTNGNGGSPSERARIDSSGRLLVGTSTAQTNNSEISTLDGNIALVNDDAYSTSLTRQLTYYSSTASYGVQPTANIVFNTVGDAASAISFLTRSSPADYAERLRITSDGKLGLGTSSVVAGAQLAAFGSQMRAGANTYMVPAGNAFLSVNSVGGQDNWIGSNGGGYNQSAGSFNILLAAGHRDANEPAGSFIGSTRTGVATHETIQIGHMLAGTTNSSKVPRLTISSSGNVGVGTTSPGATLDVAPDANRNFQVQGKGGTTYGLEIKNGTANSGGEFHVTAASNGGVVFNRGTTEMGRFDSNSRLLVGTSSTQQVGSVTTNLQVAGTTAGSSSISAIRHSADANPPYLTLGKSRGSLNGVTAVVNNDLLGYIEFAGANGTDISSIAARISAEVDGEVGTAGDTTDMPGRLVFSTTADGSSSPTERMRIKSTGIVNVGNTPVYADNAAAKAGGLVDGDIYRKSDGTLMIVYT